MHAFKAPSSFRSQHKTVGRRSLKVVEARNKQHRLNKSAPKLSVYESRLGKVQLVFQLPIFAIYPPNTRAILRISTGKIPKTASPLLHTHTLTQQLARNSCPCRQSSQLGSLYNIQEKFIASPSLQYLYSSSYTVVFVHCLLLLLQGSG